MEALGIDPKLILAQIFNFLVLFIVLKKFLYKPLLKFFQERKKKIEEGLLNSEKIKKELEEMESERKESRKAAIEEAKAIVAQELKVFEKQKEEMLTEAKSQAQKEIVKGQEVLKLETEKMRENLSKEAVEIALAMTKKMIGDLTEEDKHKLVEKSLQ